MSCLSGQPLQPLCGPSFSTCPLCAQIPWSLGRLGTVGFRDHLYSDCSQIPLSTSHLTPGSTHFSNCLLNIPLILSPDTQTHHCKKEFGVTFSSRPAWSWVSPFAPGRSHPHSKQLRQQPSRYPGVSLPLLSPICVTSLPFSQLLPNNVHVHHLFPEHLEPLPNWSSASSLPILSCSPQAIRESFLISRHTHYSPLNALQYCPITFRLEFTHLVCLLRPFWICSLPAAPASSLLPNYMLDLPSQPTVSEQTRPRNSLAGA